MRIARVAPLVLAVTFEAGCLLFTSFDGLSTGAADAGVDVDAALSDGSFADATPDAGEADGPIVSELDPSWTPKWDKIVLYLKFNGSGTLATGDRVSATVGRNATAFNANGTGLAYVAGQREQAIAFDGIDDYLEILDDDSLTFGTAFTLSAWIRVNAIDEEDAILNKWAQNQNLDEYLLSVTPTRSVNVAWHTTGPGVFGVAANNAFSSSGTISLGVWNHVVGVRSSTTITIFINGAPAGTGPVADDNPMLNTPSSVRIGAEMRGGVNRNVDGAIDEVALWNEALTQDEVEAIYARQTAR
jgi:hypothetical protein